MIQLKLTHLARPSADGNELVRSLIQITSEQSEVRVPTHFVLLLDTSGSMEEKNKLQNVKRCVEILLTILNDNDKISLITFSDSSETVLKRVPADSVHKSTILSKVLSVQAEGSTNLSASIANLKSVISEDTMKTGVILLTDGHANRGVVDVPTVLEMFRTVKEQNPLLTTACLAYGSDHNAELLKAISSEGSGSYSLVTNLEDAATAIGDVFGSFISCCAQNVDLHLPLTSTVEGPVPVVANGSSLCIKIGDIYSGSNTMYVVNLPANLIREEKPLLTMYGTLIPSLNQLNLNCDLGEFSLERNKDVELTLLRYTCASLFKQLAKWDTLTTVERANLQEEIRRFEDATKDEFFAGHSLIQMLKSEAQSLQTSITLLVERRVHGHTLHTHLIQHESVMTSGRGYTQAIEEADPENHEIRSAAPTDVTSPFRNPIQRTVAHAMRTMSSRH